MAGNNSSAIYREAPDRANSPLEWLTQTKVVIWLSQHALPERLRERLKKRLKPRNRADTRPMANMQLTIGNELTF
jgi:hypothetical protein